MPEVFLGGEGLLGLLPEVIGFDEGQQIAAPAEIRIGWTPGFFVAAVFGVIELGGREGVVNVVKVVQGQADLLEIILAA